MEMEKEKKTSCPPPKHIQQALPPQPQLLIHLPPHPNPTIPIPTMRHRLLLPHPVEIPPPTLPRLHARRRMRNGETALLRRDPEDPGRGLEDPFEPGRVGVEVPDPGGDVAGVHAVDGDVGVGGVLEEAALKLGEPDLEE